MRIYVIVVYAISEIVITVDVHMKITLFEKSKKCARNSHELAISVIITISYILLYLAYVMLLVEISCYTWFLAKFS